jgi:DNA-binding MarR family transcriptional regulator
LAATATGLQATTVGLKITDARFAPNGTVIVAQAAPKPKIRRVDLVSGRITTVVRHARGVPSQLFSLLGWIRVLQPVSPGDLSFSTGIAPTTLRDYLRRLTTRGDIRRTPNPSDGRSYLIVLTAAGMRTVDRGRPAIDDAFRKLEPYLPRAAEEYARYATELREALQRATLMSASAVARSS